MLWVQAHEGHLSFWRWARGGKQCVGQLPLDATHASEQEKWAFDALLSRTGRSPLGVALSNAQVLCKQIGLPLAASQNLRQVLAFELGRQTPFTHEQAYFDARTLGKIAPDSRYGWSWWLLQATVRRTQRLPQSLGRQPAIHGCRE